MNFDRFACRVFGHRWRDVHSITGAWWYCKRCGETREVRYSPAPRVLP